MTISIITKVKKPKVLNTVNYNAIVSICEMIGGVKRGWN